MERHTVLAFMISVLFVNFIDGVQELSEEHRTKRSLTSARRDEIRSMSPDDRPSCKPGAIVPSNRVDTTERLRALREQMTANNITAYIIRSEDAHFSEYPSEYDERRKFISGMSGSAGFAIVTSTKAALWTDGRYFLQAEDELDCNWILMKSGEKDVPSSTQWMLSELGVISNAAVGANPFLLSSGTWKSYSNALKKENITLTAIKTDLIDEIWTTDRPAQPDSPINALPMEFAGLEWQKKIENITKAMQDEGADAMIVTGLDETAWLLNLRAADILYNPFFLSYIIVNRKEDNIKLYIINKDKKLTQNPTDSETKTKLHEHLNTMTTGSCEGKTGKCVTVLEYNATTVETEVDRVAQNSDKVWISYTCNYALYSKIPQEKVLQANTPVALQKAQKNEVERNGMRKSHIRDAVALITFMTRLEKEVKAGVHWTEVSAAAELKKERLKQLYNRGLSFPSISGSGSNGAVIHYFPTNITDKAITTKDMYLLDSGGQYLDGTTDVTRTFHFGNPTDYEKECYTRVLIGHVDLSMMVWIRGMYGREIDSIARRPLWDVGLQYRHGTGHGIGMYLSVHEGPGRISLSHASFESDSPLNEWQFFSDEPGYYEDGKFGIRLENIVMVKKVDTKYKFPNTVFLGFESITLVPYEPNLIQYELLSQRQIDWINNYHKKVMDTVGPLLKTTNPEAYSWVERRTRFISRNTSGAENTICSFLIVTLSILFSCAS